ncbi:MAG: PIN domain-containing protein [Candidatus Paceibacterota bacterium]
MQPILIDANVVISFLVDRIPRQQEQAAVLFQSAADQQARILLHQHVLAETVYVLLNVYDQPVADVAATASDLVTLPGIERVDRLNDARLFELWPATIRDFGDAVIAAVASEEKCPVATFDAKLRRLLKKLGLAVWAWS